MATTGLVVTNSTGAVQIDITVLGAAIVATVAALLSLLNSVSAQQLERG